MAAPVQAVRVAPDSIHMRDRAIKLMLLKIAMGSAGLFIWVSQIMAVEPATIDLTQWTPRPEKANLEKDYPIRLQKPIDSPYGPYADGFPAAAPSNSALTGVGPVSPIGRGSLDTSRSSQSRVA
jgi:hypothetical protein